MRVMQMTSTNDLKIAEAIRLTIPPPSSALPMSSSSETTESPSGLILLTIESGSVRMSGSGTDRLWRAAAKHFCY